MSPMPAYVGPRRYEPHDLTEEQLFTLRAMADGFSVRAAERMLLDGRYEMHSPYQELVDRGYAKVKESRLLKLPLLKLTLHGWLVAMDIPEDIYDGWGADSAATSVRLVSNRNYVRRRRRERLLPLG